MSPVNHRIQFGDSNSVYSLPVLVYESMAADKADNCEYKNDQRYNRNEKLALLAETETTRFIQTHFFLAFKLHNKHWNQIVNHCKN
jgi:hypothetical protein